MYWPGSNIYSLIRNVLHRFTHSRIRNRNQSSPIKYSYIDTYMYMYIYTYMYMYSYACMVYMYACVFCIVYTALFWMRCFVNFLFFSAFSFTFPIIMCALCTYYIYIQQTQTYSKSTNSRNGLEKLKASMV